MNLVTSFFLVRKIAAALPLFHESSHLPEAPTLYDSLPQHVRERQDEYIQCILQNASCSCVSRLGLLVQDTPSLVALKSIVVPQLRALGKDKEGTLIVGKVVPFLHQNAPEQPTYSDLFHLGNKMSILFQNKATMVCNADIALLDQTFNFPYVQKLLEREKVALALTRYENEFTEECPLIDDYRGSHDAFIFRAPLPQEVVAAVNHPQNCYKAENIVIAELQRAAFHLLNPCRSVKIFHKHQSQVRQWLPPWDPEERERYGKVPPT